VRPHTLWVRRIAAGAAGGLMALGIALPAAAQPAAAAAAPTPPVAASAVRSDHAQQAAMLAAARAGARIVAVGDHGIVLLSDDGGQSHRQAQSVPLDVTLTSVSFVDDKLGWAAGHWGVVLHTRDGGETWTPQRVDTTQDRPLFGIHFFDANHGVAVGLWSLVLVTADGGRSWRTVEMPIPAGAKKADLNLLGLFAGANGSLFAAGERGMVLRSDDRGSRWTYLATGYKGSFWSGIVAADGAIFAAGLRGSLYRSTDDGRSWARLDTQSKSSITALARVGEDIIGVGLDGLVLRSSDSGASFRVETRSDRAPLTALAVNTAGRLVLYSRQGVVRPNGSVK
jgi:photosystem II stability/assembly factor-like uncharacterized protein